MSWFSTILPQKKIFQSNINGPISFYSFLNKKTLLSGGVTQSGGFSVEMWEKAVKEIRNLKLEIRNCLLLGLGGGTVVGLLQKNFPNIQITAIELDPVMIHIFKMNSHDVKQTKIFQSDAITWVNNNSKKKFDLVIVDLYIGRFNPKEAKTQSFLRKLKNFVCDGGVILYNSDYQFSQYPRFLHTCRRLFTIVEEIQLYPLSRLLLLQ